MILMLQLAVPAALFALLLLAAAPVRNRSRN